jgi:hypothetical protein
MWVFELHTASVCCVALHANLRGSGLRLPKCGIVSECLCGFAVQLCAEHAHSRLARVDPRIPRAADAVHCRFERSAESNTGRRLKLPLGASAWSGGCTVGSRLASV